MDTEQRISQALQIIGEAVSISLEDFHDDETWEFLGLSHLLAEAIAADLRNQLGIDLEPRHFQRYASVGAFKTFLRGDDARRGAPLVRKPDRGRAIVKPKIPLSIILQGDPTTARRIVFLFPDGSGAGASYSMLPALAGDICLVGLNSPFLRNAESFTCSVEHMARLWIDEVRRLQPKGKSFTLGGWSAGGYYAFEVAKLLAASDDEVERLILIDTPCRLRYEALPESVVEELTRKGLMGASGEKKAPDWLVRHFTSTVRSVERYFPIPMAAEQVPSIINFIWAKEGLVESVAGSGLEVDLSVKVTRFLLEPRADLQAEGWEGLLPGAVYAFDHIKGNHFQITSPPNVSITGKLPC